MTKFWRTVICIEPIIFLSILAILSICGLPEDYLLDWKSAGFCTALLFGFSLICWYWRWVKLAQIAFCFSFAGIALGYAHSQALNLLHQAQIAPHKIERDFRILSIHHTGDYQSLVLETLAQENQPAQRIYANWKLQQQPKQGEIWRGELQLRPISSRLNFGGFDRQRWYLAQRITAWASVKSAVKIGEDFSWRERLFIQVQQQTQDLPQQGLLLALSFGERAWLAPQSWRLYQQTNTAHLIAISGLHIGLAMAIGFYLGRALQFALPTNWITPNFPIFCGLILAFVYAELAGFAIPTVRALAALAIVFALRLRRLYCTPWQLYFRIIAILLLCEPMMAISNSFWLSVGAVGSLILWYQMFPFSTLLWRGKPLSESKMRWIFSLFHLQLGLFLIFTPIQLAFFDGFSTQALGANLLLLPLFSLVLVPILFIALFISSFANTEILWQLANQVAEFGEWILSYFQSGWLDLSERQSAIFSMILALLAALFVFYLYQFLPRKLGYKIKLLNLSPKVLAPRQYWLIQGFFLSLALGFGVKACWHYGERADWRFEMLDVGQGLSALIVKNQRGILFDSGSSWGNGGSMAALEILPYLHRQGVALDYLVLSHDDNDHSGGARAILSAFPQAKLISSSRQNYGETHRIFCQTGMKLDWQGLHIAAVAPDNIQQKAKNADSCVLLVQDSFHKILLMGDADKAVEQRILSALPKVDVLLVGHHGSKTSSSAPFVRHIQPKIALISSGRWNPWGFPHSSVLHNFAQTKTAVYNSAVSGQIAISFVQNHIEIHRARNPFSPWYQQLIGLKTHN